MPKNIQAPTEKPGTMPDSTAYEHPAFGQIGAARVQGGAVLYGSDFIHQHYMTITVRRSELHRDLSRDWHFGREELVSVALSEAQWATFVSTPNSGMGVPCTLERVRGETIPGLPVRRQEDAFKAELHETLAEAATKVEATIAAIHGELGAGLSEKKKAGILKHLDRLRRDLDDSLPFAARSFEKHMENTVEKAKIEVNAYVESHIHRAGLAALQNGEAPLLQLAAPKDAP